MADNVKALLDEVARRADPVRKQKRQKVEPRGISDTKRLRSNRDRSISAASSGQLLRFTTGKVVRIADCPKGISAHGHWLFLDNAENLPDTVPNCMCRCSVPDEFPDKET